MRRGLLVAGLLLAACGGDPVWMDVNEPAAVALTQDCRGTCDVCSTLSLHDSEILQMQQDITDLKAAVSDLQAGMADLQARCGVAP